MLCNDINLDISLKEFQDIKTNLKRYKFILMNIMDINLCKLEKI